MRQIGWRTVVGAVLLAGIVHISATLAVPLLGPGNAFRKLRETLPVNQMVFLPPPTPGNAAAAVRGGRRTLRRCAAST